MPTNNHLCPCGNKATHKRSGQNVCDKCSRIEDQQPQNKARIRAGFSATHKNQHLNQSNIDHHYPIMDEYRFGFSNGKTPVKGGME